MAVPTRIDTPEGVLRAFIDAWHARDGAAIGALFTPDGDFVNVTGLWWHGPEAIARPHQYALDGFFAATRLKAGRTEVKDLGDVAILRSRLHLTGQLTPDASAAGPRQTILTLVMVRTEAGWRVTSAQNTDIHPGRETHVATEGDLIPTRYGTGRNA